jgi:predicted nucleic acid-binding protein
MNTWRKRPVTLIVADAGPLISLACADELRLLQSFGHPVVIADVVRKECTRKFGAPGEARLSQWFETAGGNQFKELDTPFLDVFTKAMAKEASGEDPEATVGLGDAAISWILKNLSRLKAVDGQSLSVGPNELALVLTEDGPYGDGPILMKRHAHVLSTRGWLKTLERLGLIPSYKAVIDEIQKGGRHVGRYMADRPATPAEGVQSDWKDGTEAVISQWLDERDPQPDDNDDGSGGGASGGPGGGRK